MFARTRALRRQHVCDDLTWPCQLQNLLRLKTWQWESISRAKPGSNLPGRKVNLLPAGHNLWSRCWLSWGPSLPITARSSGEQRQPAPRGERCRATKSVRYHSGWWTSARGGIHLWRQAGRIVPFRELGALKATATGRREFCLQACSGCDRWIMA